MRAHSPDNAAASIPDRPLIFLAVAAAAHGIAVFCCPNIVVPPRISTHIAAVRVTAIVCSIPFIFSVALLLGSWTRSQRVIACVSLAASVFWLFYGGDLIIWALKGP